MTHRAIFHAKSVRVVLAGRLFSNPAPAVYNVKVVLEKVPRLVHHPASAAVHTEHLQRLHLRPLPRWQLWEESLIRLLKVARWWMIRFHFFQDLHLLGPIRPLEHISNTSRKPMWLRWAAFRCPFSQEDLWPIGTFDPIYSTNFSTCLITSDGNFPKRSNGGFWSVGFPLAWGRWGPSMVGVGPGMADLFGNKIEVEVIKWWCRKIRIKRELAFNDRTSPDTRYTSWLLTQCVTPPC